MDVDLSEFTAAPASGGGQRQRSHISSASGGAGPSTGPSAPASSSSFDSSGACGAPRPGGPSLSSTSTQRNVLDLNDDSGGDEIMALHAPTASGWLLLDRRSGLFMHEQDLRLNGFNPCHCPLCICRSRLTNMGVYNFVVSLKCGHVMYVECLYDEAVRAGRPLFE